MAFSKCASVVYRNLADDAVITASSSIVLAQPDVLQQEDVGRKWESLSGTASLTIDFGAEKSIDTAALIGIEANTARCRMTSQGGTTGDRYDSTAKDVGPYGQGVWLLEAPALVRSITIDLVNAPDDWCRAGRMVAGRRSTYGVNYEFGSSATTVDPSPRSRTMGNQIRIERRPLWRVFEINFPLISDADRWAFVEDIEREAALQNDILLILDPSSSNLPRDTIWGLLSDASPIIQAHHGYHSKTYRIEERP